jgi:hypothetical protein
MHISPPAPKISRSVYLEGLLAPLLLLTYVTYIGCISLYHAASYLSDTISLFFLSPNPLG